MTGRLIACFAFVAGIMLGSWLSNPSKVHAQFGAAVVTVTEVYPLTTRNSVRYSGSVVGFSCTRNREGEPDCYVATQ